MIAEYHSDVKLEDQIVAEQREMVKEKKSCSFEQIGQSLYDHFPRSQTVGEQINFEYETRTFQEKQ